MAVVIEMPRMSDTMKEGTIVSWLKKEGDEIESGQLLAEVETDKAVMEYEAEEDGIILKVLIDEKQPAPIGFPICIIGESADELEEAMAAADALREKIAGGGAEPAEEAPAPTPAPAAAPAPAPAAVPVAKTAPVAAPAPVVPVAPSADGRVKKSPLAAKMAAENGLDVALIPGTGPGGRVVKRDILSALERGIGKIGSAGTGFGARAQPGVLPPVTAPPFSEEATSQMRRVIAERLVESKSTAPHFYLTMGIDMGRAMDLRKQLNALQEIQKISVNDMIVKAVALAGRDVPKANASWVQDAAGIRIRTFQEVHVGVAVAIEDGLVTPVIRDAVNKSLLDIAIEIRTLAAAAKSRKLGGEYYGDNTVTVSNLGMFGVESFTAIINPPASIILAVGSVEEVPVVQDGALAVGTRMNVTLSCDHRVVDGALGAQWLAAFKKHLENPVSLVL